MGRQLLGIVLSVVIGSVPAAWSTAPQQGSAASPTRAVLVFVGMALNGAWIAVTQSVFVSYLAP